MAESKAKALQKELSFEYSHIAKSSPEQIEKAEEFSKGYKVFLNRGKTEREVVKEVVALLESSGLSLGSKSEGVSSTVPVGHIISQSPAAGASVDSSTAIDYVICVGAIQTSSAESTSGSESGSQSTSQSGSQSTTQSSSQSQTTQASTERVTPSTQATTAATTQAPTTAAGSYRYVASIDTNYSLEDVIGPSSGLTSVKVMVRLRQTVNGSEVYSTLMEPRTVTGDTILPIRFRTIVGANGVDQGQVEVVNSDSGQVMKSYTVEFFKVE